MKRLIVCNWKQNIISLAQAREILDLTNQYLESRGEDINFSIVICPPAELLAGVGEILKESHLEHQASLGAQDLVENVPNVRYVIIGHSDRRWGLGESDEIVNEKLKKTLTGGLIPIVCVGEKVQDDRLIFGLGLGNQRLRIRGPFNQ